ncbi:MAG: imidazole glycerol phosphate synthase subunit HisH, partial [Parcubacteria group bacterium]|nr:imidazole glycerol phosphate synthase subunit HisH [Parcubacteria group bacterium]
MKKSKIIIIDYGVGNVRSVANTLTFLGYDFVISKNKSDIKKATCLVLAGVGAFAEGMKNLKDFNLIDILNEQVIKKNKPMLGICLG